MIISPPFLPVAGLTSSDTDPDPMMTVVDGFELAHHGVYPIAFDRRWHCGSHLAPTDQTEPVRAIADGDVIAYRVSKNAITDGQVASDGSPILNSNTGFVLLKHVTDTDDGRTITFYSLYMHLLDMTHQQGLVPQPANPPAEGSATALPAWLLDTGAGANDGAVQLGTGKKVYRKDMLGYWGSCHGMPHLHCEIFMTEADFTAWFEQDGHKVQLGEKSPVTPASKDYWGHSYFVIPGGQAFVSVPAGQSGSEYFPPQTVGTLDANSKLYVEAYFHKGERYTRSWIDRGDGTVILLTPSPVKDPYSEYEYTLYQRATHFYTDCPSEGYELLRFGRILSTDQPTLSASAQVTWVAVPYDENGTQGYIDISQTAIQKLSDADFPFFTGWQKIGDENTPFDQDGLCGYDELKKLVNDVDAAESPSQHADPEFKQEDQLVAYVHGNASVRDKLRGFVCHAPSEWDGSNSNDRYKGLNEPDGFFGSRKDSDPDGYKNFTDFLKKFQFLDQTSLGGGQKFWFFHPLAFIRHFRKCGWLHMTEFEQIYSDSRYSRHQQPSPSQLRSMYLTPLNVAARKFGMLTATRLSHFLGQGAVESGWLSNMQEASMAGRLEADGLHGAVTNPASTVSESGLGHWYGQLPAEDDAWFRSTKFNSHGARITSSYDWRNGNCDREDAQKFRGRGFKQLTGRSNYADYWNFRGWISSPFSKNWWTDPAFIAHNRNGMVAQPANIDSPQRVAVPENCIDSGGFYLRFNRSNTAIEIDKDSPTIAITVPEKAAERTISRAVTFAINGGYIDDVRRLEFTRVAKGVLG
jgi:hypothetical protein